MRSTVEAVRGRWARLRAYGSFFLVATAQLLSPAAAADPASRIVPPPWSHRHSEKEIEAYGKKASLHESEKKPALTIREAKLRRLLRRHEAGGR